MHGFSTVDGFVEINECLADMIKYLANEPSVGLFYIQQHTQNAVPNVTRLRNTVQEKSHETNLHTEDLEDSITMLNSMKECGSPIAVEMIRDIKESLAIMSTKKPRKGLLRSNPSTGFQMGHTSSWGPATWGRTATYAQPDGEQRVGYFSNVLKSAKQKASNFNWPRPDLKDVKLAESEKQLSTFNPPLSVASASTSSDLLDSEADEQLPLSNQVPEDLQDVESTDGNFPSQHLWLASENYDDFKANRQVKLEEWLKETGKKDKGEGASDANGALP